MFGTILAFRDVYCKSARGLSGLSRTCMSSCWSSCAWFSPPQVGLQIWSLHTLPLTWQLANCSWRGWSLATVDWWFLRVLHCIDVPENDSESRICFTNPCTRTGCQRPADRLPTGMPVQSQSQSDSLVRLMMQWRTLLLTTGHVGCNDMMSMNGAWEGRKQKRKEPTFLTLKIHRSHWNGSKGRKVGPVHMTALHQEPALQQELALQHKRAVARKCPCIGDSASFHRCRVCSHTRNSTHGPNTATTCWSHVRMARCNFIVPAGPAKESCAIARSRRCYWAQQAQGKPQQYKWQICSYKSMTWRVALCARQTQVWHPATLAAVPALLLLCLVGEQVALQAPPRLS